MNKFITLILVLLVNVTSVALAAEQVFYYHTDPVGTPLAMTNASGVVTWKADYKPFGEENTVSGSAVNTKQFVGKEKDSETGLSYFGARYEDAKIGKFTAVDPVRVVDPVSNKTNEEMLLNPQRLNSYAYSLNNPYRYLDPDGNHPTEILKCHVNPHHSPNNPRLDAIYRTENVMGGVIVGSGLAWAALAPANGIWASPSSGRQIINGIEYTTHALERMAPFGLIQQGKQIMSRGVPPSVVENVIKYGKKMQESREIIVHTYENVKVVTNEFATRVITVIKTGK